MKPENDVAERATIRENKLSLVERLADDLAHEIKNPLHSMVINLEVLRRRIARLDVDSTDDLLRYASILNAELERVNRRVDLLLRMVRPDRDSDEPATLHDILEELHELVALECERHEVAYHQEVSNELLRIRLPRTATRQMILGLILKTLDALPAGAALRLVANNDEHDVRLLVCGTVEPAIPAPSADAAREGPYYAAARALAETIGGNLERCTRDETSNSAASTCHAGYILTLPSHA